MPSIGSYEAKTHLPRLLDEVAGGSTYTITKHGRPVARLVGLRPVIAQDDLVAAFAAARAGKRLGMPVRQAIEEGRR
ncbi:MAG: type II toxin-antitoxin system prevent-host-death family antitoxin [Austwickia sp.]|nr:type II toxin-antitoxin system prevent-host-death family antitoxin [Actinomycetota bacterium]MCB1254765.1 type II toxin-antitoxin system prevent-host-death family antitoxin [Austwickia sp.]MCO5309909.1 type II toxin-antitoxin system prevent-host-death family antitoxin [Austwickia sp.]